MVDRCIRILVISLRKLPAWPALVIALGIWSHDREINDIGKAFDVTDEVCAVGEGTEKACGANVD